MGQERRLGFGDSDRASTSRLRSSREAGAAEVSTTRVAMTLKRMVPFPMVPFRIRQGARSGAAPVGPAVTSDLLPRRRGHERIPALAQRRTAHYSSVQRAYREQSTVHQSEPLRHNNTAVERLLRA